MLVRTFTRIRPGLRYKVRHIEHIFPELDIRSVVYLTRPEVLGHLYDVLKELTEFFDREEVPYNLTHGTLLGALRHQGFLPWDDDIDLNVLAPYDKESFLELFQSKLGHRYRVRDFGPYVHVSRLDTRFGFPYADIRFSNKRLPPELMYPLRRVPFEDLEVSIPNRAVEGLPKYIAIDPDPMTTVLFDVPLPWINSHWFDAFLTFLIGGKIKQRWDHFTLSIKKRLGTETCRRRDQQQRSPSERA